MQTTTSPSPQAVANPDADSIYDSNQQPSFSVLLLDDEPSIVNALYRVLRTEGYVIHRANSGVDALSIMKEEPVDLVISDMRMPNMSGAEFLEQVAINHPETVRILLTGYADMESTVAAINKGKLHRYCTKPWNDDDIKMVIKQSLEAKHLKQQKERLQHLADSQYEEILALNASLEEKVATRTAELESTTLQLKESFKASLKVFTNLTELREQGNPGHNRRVASRSRKLSETMGLDSEQTETVYFGALLHDLGKIGLPDSVIGVPKSQLKGKDLEAFQKHPEIGHASLIAFEPLHGAAEIIKAHHERYDGQGYPEGISKDEIPLGARILAVADEFDSLLVGNEYRKPMNQAEAQSYISNQSGKRFDPDVIDALFTLLSTDTSDNEIASVSRLKLQDVREGMILAEDLKNEDDVLLLPEGYRMTETLIKRLRDLKNTGSTELVLSISTQSVTEPEIEEENSKSEETAEECEATS